MKLIACIIWTILLNKLETLIEIRSDSLTSVPLQEVIEQIIIHTDYNTIMGCLLVSKYWHYHATKSHIQQHVFLNEYECASNKFKIAFFA